MPLKQMSFRLKPSYFERDGPVCTRSASGFCRNPLNFCTHVMVKWWYHAKFQPFLSSKIANEVRKIFSTGFNHKPVLQALCFFQLTSTNQEEAHVSLVYFKRFVVVGSGLSSVGSGLSLPIYSPPLLDMFDTHFIDRIQIIRIPCIRPTVHWYALHSH